MVKAIPMEDWLRGCIYHDGRHGYVTLPINKVHQIANYIQRTRRSGMDGLIDLEVVEADRKTDSNSKIPNNCEVECEKCKHFREEADTYMKQCEFYFMECRFEPKDEPQTCEDCEHWNDTEDGCADRHGCKTEPQTVRSNLEPFRVDEPQTEMTTEQIVNELLSIKKILDDGKMPKQRCGNCKHLTYRWNKTWCDIKCDNPHDMVCDKWERSE